jgi:DNA-binding NarL/FixJ family response regulator
LLVDDHVVVRAGLRLLLEDSAEMSVVGETNSISEAVEIARRERPDIVLLDLLLGDENALDHLPRLVGSLQGGRVIVVTCVRDPAVHQHALQLGAMGILAKEEGPDVLLKAIKKVHAGEAWIDRVTMAGLLAEMSAAGKAEAAAKSSQADLLTKRERDIVVLVARGLKNKLIASHLGISEVTVRHHLTSIYAKLALADRYELIVYTHRALLSERP